MTSHTPAVHVEVLDAPYSFRTVPLGSAVLSRRVVDEDVRCRESEVSGGASTPGAPLRAWYQGEGATWITVIRTSLTYCKT